MSTTEKIAASPSSDEAGQLDVEEMRRLDAQNITLAQAVEQAQLAMETSIKIKGEVVAELERFRRAMRTELKGHRFKPDTIRDVAAIGGLISVASGVAVAFHWSFSLIATGIILLALSVIPLFRPVVKT